MTPTPTPAMADLDKLTRYNVAQEGPRMHPYANGEYVKLADVLALARTSPAVELSAEKVASWQERSVGPDALGLYPDAFACMQAEIADLRAIAASRRTAAPVAKVVSRHFDGVRVGWLRPEDCNVGDMLYLAAPVSAEPAVQVASTRERRIYVAGPMTGLPEFNFPAFNDAAKLLRVNGWHVENPAEHGIVEGAEWADYLHYDIGRLATCCAVYLLPGWSKSRGAALEVSIAQALGMEIQYAPDAESAAPASPPDGAVIFESLDCPECGAHWNKIRTAPPDGAMPAGSVLKPGQILAADRRSDMSVMDDRRAFEEWFNSGNFAEGSKEAMLIGWQAHAEKKKAVASMDRAELQIEIFRLRAALDSRVYFDEATIEAAALKHIATDWHLISHLIPNYRCTDQFARLKAFAEELASGFREGRNTQGQQTEPGQQTVFPERSDTPAPDALDARRYRGWRDGMLASDQKLIDAMQDALPPEVGKDRHPTADEWDKALDIALRIDGDKQGAQGDA